MNESHNYAFIDGQNLHLGTMEDGWKIDFVELKTYLKKRYRIQKIYFFMGYNSPTYQNLYNKITNAGFHLVFKEHDNRSISKKKGNIDVDLVFELMSNLIDNQKMNKVLIISGDGDYFKLVNYLIKKKRFIKILFPNKKALHLYRDISDIYYDYLFKIKQLIKFNNKNGG